MRSKTHHPESRKENQLDEGLLPLLTGADCQFPRQAALIIAEDVEGEALATRSEHVARHLQCAAGKPPVEIAARPCSKTSADRRQVLPKISASLENVKIEDPGRAKKITIDKDNTTIIEGGGKSGELKAASSKSVHVENTTPITTARSAKSARPAGRRRCGLSCRRGD
jgi:chaperonin GroEL